MEIAEEARVWCERRPGPSREGGQYCWADVRGEGWAHHRSFFLCTLSEVARHQQNKLQG